MACGSLDLRDIFGSLFGSTDDREATSRELVRCLLLDPTLRAALRGSAASRARCPAECAALTRRPPASVAGLAAGEARGCEAGSQRQPVDRPLPGAAVV